MSGLKLPAAGPQFSAHAFSNLTLLRLLNNLALLHPTRLVPSLATLLSVSCDGV